MALRAKVIDLVRLHLAHDPRQVRTVGKIAIMQDQIGIILVRVLINMINPLRIKR